MELNQVHKTIQFIVAYREIEKSPTKEGEEIIKYVIKDIEKAQHLCNSWGGRKQNWGSFYLNLSHADKYRFLRFWGISDSECEDYLIEASKRPLSTTLFGSVPRLIKWFHELMVFFNNHMVEKSPATGMVLKTVPKDENYRYDSTGWGNYILSLPDGEQEHVLQQIESYCMEGRK